ncbi:hypothetical protein NGM10_12545 [Halorussus salilacus]|uniref:hypothetical protein n=1 Tax=Halorussus salilacus TaxID=2953750 RepID=UPI00209D3FAE|nr:hypothetical protein [Halorussus salilacus]USZ67552.1 hypothetical protein NGM10_12545 [Halorussus salilacus]
MSNRASRPTLGRENHPIATELAFAVCAVGGFALWHHTASTVASSAVDALSLPGGLPVEGLLGGSLLLAGSFLFAGAYVTLRDIEVGVALPSADDLPLVGVAIALPAVLVGLTKFVGALTGVPYGSLTMTAVAADVPLEPFLVVTGLGLFVGVPSYLLTCQVVVQGSLGRVTDGDIAVVATTAVASFLLLSARGGLSPFPERGRLGGAVLFVATIGVALFAADRVGRRWLRALSYLPALVLFGVAALSGVAAVESVAGGLFVTTQVAVLGLAAYAYDRTDSLLVPALAYASLLATGQAVVFVFEAGVQGW